MDSLVSVVATSNNSWFARLNAALLANGISDDESMQVMSYLNCKLGLVNSIGTSQT